LRQQTKQRGALPLLRDTLESGADLGANDVPILPFGRCLSREPMEREAFLGREGRVAQEVVQALRKTGGDDLSERTDGRTNPDSTWEMKPLVSSSPASCA